MEHQPFTIAQMRPIRDCMTVSRPANLGKEVPVTWFSLGAGTTITPESYDCTTLYVGAMGNAKMAGQFPLRGMIFWLFRPKHCVEPARISV